MERNLFKFFLLTDFVMTKRFLFASLVLLLAFSSLSFSQTKEKKASIQLDSTTANIGTFPKSASSKTVVYTFKNVGNEKLVFYDAQPDCGCITVDLPEKPVKPGKVGKIVVHYKGLYKRPGRYNHKINFACSGSPAYFQLRLRFVMTEK